ncbi:hypothetical protein F4805DRAFT_454733 [Annulohypoxylon moriforme]|nr:hypothetical protein F4805DRAFT_454733 [Annulohypoxylon moriforme]
MRAFATSFVFPAVAFAAAITQRGVPEGPWTAGAWRTPGDLDDFPLLGNAINASGGKFYINNGTSAYCPDEVEELDCSLYPGTRTVFSGGNDTLFLDVGVPGGQQVYIAKDGSLSYTGPHSGAIPEGSTVTGWQRQQSESFGAPIVLANNNHFWNLCPVSEGEPRERTYQVYVGQTQKGCVNTGVRTYTTEGPNAWEYI